MAQAVSGARLPGGAGKMRTGLETCATAPGTRLADETRHGLDPRPLAADAARGQAADHGLKVECAVLHTVQAYEAHAAPMLAVMSERNAGVGGGLHA